MSENVIEIVRAKSNDAPVVAELFDAYRQFYEQPPAARAALDFITERLVADESVIFLALDSRDGRTNGAGFVQLFPSFTSVGLARTWILNDLYVAAACRRLGVGRRLMERAIEFGRETGRARIALETGTDNFSAKPLYESLGFALETGIDHYDLSVTPRG